jgi:hypothetical protein
MERQLGGSGCVAMWCGKWEGGGHSALRAFRPPQATPTFILTPPFVSTLRSSARPTATLCLQAALRGALAPPCTPRFWTAWRVWCGSGGGWCAGGGRGEGKGARVSTSQHPQPHLTPVWTHHSSSTPKAKAESKGSAVHGAGGGRSARGMCSKAQPCTHGPLADGGLLPFPL